MPPKKFILTASGGLVQSTDAGRDHSSSSYSYPPSASSAGRIRPNVSRVPFLLMIFVCIDETRFVVTQNGHEEKWDYSKSIPGVAGRDYPILSAVVPTSFSCNGRKDGGYYADVESSCQVIWKSISKGGKHFQLRRVSSSSSVSSFYFYVFYLISLLIASSSSRILCVSSRHTHTSSTTS
jgi:hypothetical protein